MSYNNLPAISIIIPTHGREDILRDCLSSLTKVNYPKEKLEVIIVNDGEPISRLALQEFIQSFSKLSLKNFSKRVGIASARNAGIKSSIGEILVFIDDDVIVHPMWLMNMIKPYSNEKVGGVGGRITSFYFDEFDEKIPTGYIGVTGHIHFNFKSAYRQCVTWIRGCNMSFKRELIYKVRLFDELLGEFSFSEDIDISLRIKKIGYYIIYEPTAVVIHREASRGGLRIPSEVLAYHAVRNAVYVYLKNLGFPTKLVAIPRVMIGIFSLCIRRIKKEG
ncbi:MAG: glycosyltransferase family 2 protein, partial [Candidatus Bathyarchaeia archaeon]